MADIVITEFMDQAAVDDLGRDFSVLYDRALVDDPARLAGLTANCSGLIVRNRTQVRGALLAGAEKLKTVGRLGVGLDNIDVEACAARGIAVHPATGANDLSVAEYVITALLILFRGAWSANAEVLAGAWPRSRLMGRELSGKRLGLVGFGRIARETAWRAKMLGMEVAAHDPFVPPGDPAWKEALRLDLFELLASSDAVSLHVPLLDSTRHMIDGPALASMKAEALVVNASRGGTLDETALAEALRAGRLGGAALDVFETEPLSAEAATVFKDVPDLILTPHIAGVTAESNVRVSELVAAKVRRSLTS